MYIRNFKLVSFGEEAEEDEEESSVLNNTVAKESQHTIACPIQS